MRDVSDKRESNQLNMKNIIKISATLLLVLSLLIVSFIWFLYLSTSHRIELSTHIELVAIILTILAGIITLTKSWRKFGDCFLILFVEVIIIFAYKFYQPLCEPCLTQNDCPPCISETQIFLKYLGLSIIFGFVIWKIIQSFKNNASR